jgi:hypothetical protein
MLSSANEKAEKEKRHETVKISFLNSPSVELTAQRFYLVDYFEL